MGFSKYEDKKRNLKQLFLHPSCNLFLFSHRLCSRSSHFPSFKNHSVCSCAGIVPDSAFPDADIRNRWRCSFFACRQKTHKIFSAPMVLFLYKYLEILLSVLFSIQRFSKRTAVVLLPDYERSFRHRRFFLLSAATMSASGSRLHHSDFPLRTPAGCSYPGHI